MRKLIALILTLALVLAAVPALAEGKLVVYTPNPDAEIKYILNTFADKYDVEVETLPMGTGDCYTRLVAEKEAPIADVMFGGVESTWTHDYPDLFMTYYANGNEKLPVEYQNPDGMITNYILGGSCVLIVNEELEKDLGIEIKSYADLLNPALKGQIASANPNSSSSAFAHLSNLLLAMGDGENPYESEAAWDYVAKLIEQLDGAYTSGSSAVYKGVTNGEYVVGLSYEVGVAGHIANGAQGVRAVYPTEGVCWTPVGSAIVNGAKNLDNAKLFMDWLISDECQTIMATAEGSVLRGVRTDLFVPTDYMPAFDTLNLKQEDSEYTSGNKQTILDHWNDLWNK
ncbi:MAG: extracellular solute-binding protein [Clostridia bacterium]|nr:extracellular solute-binding protein [Clostridia bacterium]